MIEALQTLQIFGRSSIQQLMGAIVDKYRPWGMLHVHVFYGGLDGAQLPIHCS